MRLKFRVAANTAAQAAGKVVSAGFNFIITILLARQLGVDGYGELTKILTFTAFFYLAADFGLNAVTVKQLSLQNENIKSSTFNMPLIALFSTRIILGLFLTFLAVGAAVFLPYFPETGEGFSQMVKLGIILFSPTILFQALIRSANSYFQYKLRYDKAATAVAAGSLISFLSVAGMVYFNANSLLAYVAFLLFSAAIQTLIALFLLKNLTKLSIIPFQIHIQKILSLLKQSAPLGLTLILNIAFFRLDTFLLAVFRSSSEVGLYGLAYKFFEFPLTLPTFFMNSLYPVLTQVKTQKHQNSKKSIKAKSNVNSQLLNIIRKSAVFLGISSVLLTIIFWVLAPYITLIKSDFAGSVRLFRILVLWLPLFFLSSLLMWTIIAREKTYWNLALIYAAGLIFNAAANIVFIPSHGAQAAAITTGVTELLVLGLLIFQNDKIG